MKKKKKKKKHLKKIPVWFSFLCERKKNFLKNNNFRGGISPVKGGSVVK